MANPQFTLAQLACVRQGRFTPLKRYKITRTVGGVNHVTYLKDVESFSITYDKGMGASTASLTINNPNGQYNPKIQNSYNSVNGIYAPLFQYMNRLDIELGMKFPDGSEKWWSKGPFWLDMPKFGQDEGFPTPVQITARDGMKRLLVDIYTGKFEPDKIAIVNETLTANETRTIYSSAHANLCKIPTPEITSNNEPVTDGYEVDYAAGKIYFSVAREADETIRLSGAYYDMSTNKIGDVITAICQDAGIDTVVLDFTTSGGTTLEPTVGLVEWTYEDKKTHFDCLRELISAYLPPNWILRQKDGQIIGNYIYQGTPLSELVPKKSVEWAESDEDVYTMCVSMGRKTELHNKCSGATIENIFTGTPVRGIEGSVANIIDEKVSTQCRWYWNWPGPDTPADMFKITFAEKFKLGSIQICIGDVEGNSCTIKGTVYVSEDGVNWFIPSSSAKGWSGSSSQWIIIDESDFDRTYEIKYLKIRMDSYGLGYDWLGYQYMEFPIREVKVFESDRIYGFATLWIETTQTATIPANLQITLANNGVLSEERLAPSIDGFTRVDGVPGPNQFSVIYGDISTPTVLTFNAANQGAGVTISYNYTTDAIKYNILNKIGKRTYVMAENTKLTTVEAANADAANLLSELWAFFDTAEIEVHWCPWVEIGETHRLRNEQLGVNAAYLVTGLVQNDDGGRISVANYGG
jgi:hypothetical protein